MSFTKKTIKDIPVDHKTVLVRADYNVPIAADGSISDDYRIQQNIPTLKYLIGKGCKVIICSHLGRPESPDDPKCTLQPVARRLTELLGQEVGFSSDCIGEEARQKSAALRPGSVLLLENVRYHEQEEKNDAKFAKRLAEATGAELFVQDGFGVVHRAHATTDAITTLLPSVAGLLLEREVDVITNVMESPKRPLMAVIGGAKIADKIDILNRYIDIADIVAVGGAMANTFLKAKGIPVAKSMIDEDDLDEARKIIEKAEAKRREKGSFIFYLPQDGVVATSMDASAKTRIVDWSAHVIADIENYPARPPAEASELREDEMILDVGPFSGSFIAGCMQLVQTVVWNGTLGVTETKGLQGPVGPFAHGTDILMDALSGRYGNTPFSVIGGGDTASYVSMRKMTDRFNHVSTGGGASLELMCGQPLPGVVALQDKEDNPPEAK